MRYGAIFMALGLFLLRSFSASQTDSCVIDDATKEPELVRFRERLIVSIKSRDIAQLRPMISPRINFQHGFEGREAFVDAYDLADPKAETWSRLEKDLRYGGRFTSTDGYCAPYFMCPTWPGEGDETVLVVLARDVPVRSRPEPAAEVLSRLSCAVLRYSSKKNGIRPKTPSGWTATPMSNGKWGFIPDENVVLAETGVYLGRHDGRWWLAGVFAAD